MALADSVPERAWKIFETVSTMIDHADRKGGAILATCGVTAATVLSLMASRKYWSIPATAAAVLTMALAFTAAGLACAALWPRRRRADSPTSLLYFDHIIRRDQTASTYSDALWNLLTDTRTLNAGIAEQIWATAHVAARKYHWLDRAMVNLIGSLAALAATGIILVVISH
jgi:Family of unknown function (DUF5706)